MAGEWIKMRTGLINTPKFMCISRDLKIDDANIILSLYRLCEWFQLHGKHGKLKTTLSVVDRIAGHKGFSEILISNGWMRNQDGILTLHGFSDVSASRKNLNKKARERILLGAKCAACNSIELLVIDHIIPISRGGSCEESNLQVLCQHCNISKGKKLPSEWKGR